MTLSVPGTQGYLEALSSFSKASLNLNFAEINADFLSVLPQLPAKVLDAGAGVGQNSAALAEMGYEVIAIEPIEEFINIAKENFANISGITHQIAWYRDCLPYLTKLTDHKDYFDFILLDGVWHHLSPDEKASCISRFFELLAPNGVCAISLRNGPAGAGSCIYPSLPAELLKLVQENNGKTIVNLDKQPSKLPNKKDVIWSRIAFQKCEEVHHE